MIHITFPSQPTPSLLHRSKSTREQKNICPAFFLQTFASWWLNHPFEKYATVKIGFIFPKVRCENSRKNLWVGHHPNNSFLWGHDSSWNPTQQKHAIVGKSGLSSQPPKKWRGLRAVNNVSPEGRWYCDCHTSIDRAKLLPSPNLKFQEIHPTNPGFGLGLSSKGTAGREFLKNGRFVKQMAFNNKESNLGFDT